MIMVDYKKLSNGWVYCSRVNQVCALVHSLIEMGQHTNVVRVIIADDAFGECVDRDWGILVAFVPDLYSNSIRRLGTPIYDYEEVVRSDNNVLEMTEKAVALLQRAQAAIVTESVGANISPELARVARMARVISEDIVKRLCSGDSTAEKKSESPGERGIAIDVEKTRKAQANDGCVTIEIPGIGVIFEGSFTGEEYDNDDFIAEFVDPIISLRGGADKYVVNFSIFRDGRVSKKTFVIDKNV